MTTAPDAAKVYNSATLTPFGTARQTPNPTFVNKTDKSSTDGALKGLNDNFDQFLKLLTTQMQNQDPLKPMDTNEMTQQLVQFANVEQNIATNKKLDTLVSLQQNNAAASNLYYLNRVVEHEGNTFKIQQGMEGVELNYELARSAKSVKVEFLDSSGRTVRSMTGETAGGKKHPVTWDLKDDAGRPVQPGEYRIRVSPKGETENELIKTTAYTFGVVTAIDFSKSGEPVLKVGDKTLNMKDVKAVY